MDIKVEHYDDKNIRLNIKGINYGIINTIRRVLLQEIPIYKIDNINIDKNTTSYTNDYLIERLEQFDDIQKSDEIYIDKNNEYKYDKQEIYINVKNDNKEIMDVTTDNIDVYINDKQIKNPYKIKYLLVKLETGQELIMKGTYILGKGLYNAKYTVVNREIYDEISENNYIFGFKSLCELSSKEILVKAIEIILIKLENISVMISQKYNDSTINDVEKTVVVLDNEDHTMGNLITAKLQEKIQAGYKMNDYVEQTDEKHVMIKIDGKQPFKHLFKTLSELKEIYSNMLKIIKKIK